MPQDAFAATEGVRETNINGRHASLSFEGDIAVLLRAALEHNIVNLNTREADLEEIFLTYYRNVEGDR